MTHILHIDASPRALVSAPAVGGSHTRRLSARFVSRWQAARPRDTIRYRDVGSAPPAMASAAFVAAAFTRPARRSADMEALLRESDTLIDELVAADVIVMGVPMYNFGVPAQFKAYVDNVVRVGRTFGFDRSREGVPYYPLLIERPRRLVVVSARGDFGYEPGEPNAHMNHVEPNIRSAFGYMGITEMESVAVEYDEYADERLRTSLAHAELRLDAIADRLLATTTSSRA